MLFEGVADEIGKLEALRKSGIALQIHPAHQAGHRLARPLKSDPGRQCVTPVKRSVSVVNRGAQRVGARHQSDLRCAEAMVEVHSNSNLANSGSRTKREFRGDDCWPLLTCRPAGFSVFAED